MSSSLEVFLKRLRDPRWIPNISDYCDSRCQRCAFAERCWSFAFRQYVENRAREQMTDFSQAEPEPSIARGDAYVREGIENIVHDPLGAIAEDYGTDVWRVIGPLMEREQDEAPGAALPVDVVGALHDVWGLALTIGAKVHRAVSSCELNNINRDEGLETDPIQNDENGSAKVARLAVAESLVSWDIVQCSGLIDRGLVEYLLGNLRQIERALKERFPLAMAFVRPGFDEEIPGIVRPWSIMPDEDDEED
jgi:hypothetical protein